MLRFMSDIARDLADYSYAHGPDCLTDNAVMTLFALCMIELDERSFFRRLKDMFIDIGWIREPAPQSDRHLREKLFREWKLDALTAEAQDDFVAQRPVGIA